MVHPDVRFVHMTDLHLTADNALLYDRVDPWQQFCTALSAAGHFHPDAVLLTGDIFDNAAAASGEFARLIDTARQELDCPVIVLPGNHDNPGNWGFQHTDVVSAGPEPGDSVQYIENIRVLSLNTHGQETLQGHLTDAQYGWIATQLATHAPAGTVVAMHHPPVPTAHPFLATVGLSDPHRLRAILQDTDVRLVLSGHLHLQTAAMLGSIPVWSGPALAYQQNAYAPDGTLQGLEHPGISVVDFFADTQAIVPVPLVVPPALFTRTIPQPPDHPPHNSRRRTS